MSGHSKWATTKRHKEAVDAKRSNIFSKFSKNIMLAAKQGADPEMNFSLRLAIDKARAANMPKDKIENAINKGSGQIGGASFSEVMYEAFGPGGVPLLIEGITDNTNRTTGEVKAILTKYGGSLGAQNSVKWMFEHKGVIHLTKEQVGDKDSMMLELIDLGADDVKEEDGGLTLECDFKNFERIKKELDSRGLKLEYAEMEWVAKEAPGVEPAIQEKIDRIIDLLEEHDDVNSVYSNLN